MSLLAFGYAYGFASATFAFGALADFMSRDWKGVAMYSLGLMVIIALVGAVEASS